MKTTWLVLLMMSCTALLEARVSAAARQQSSAVSSPNRSTNDAAPPTEDLESQTKKKPSDREGKWRDTSDEKRAIDHRSPINRPASNIRNSSSANIASYQSASTNRGAVRGGSVQNKDAHYNVTPGGVATGTPSFGNARHLSPNPAIVSGTEKRKTKNTAAIDGTKMYRKP